MSANEMQVGGKHYASTYQHWDLVQEALGCRYFEGQVTRYVARWRKKNGLEDLQKAEHYLTKLKEIYRAKQLTPIGIRARPMQAFVDACLMKFIELNDLDEDEAEVMTLMANWTSGAGLELCGHAIGRLKHEAEHAGPGRGYVKQG